MAYTAEHLKELQELPLEDKVFLSQTRIEDWYEYWKGEVCISFSGGKDSTVLLHLVRNLYPDVKAVFVDTGLEYLELKEFVKSFDNVTIIRPEMSFVDVIKMYGFCFPSKEVASHIESAKRGMDYALKIFQGQNSDGTTSTFRQRYMKWDFLVDSPFKISDKCCDIMKKDPFHKYHKETLLEPFVGTLASESALRKNAWYKRGCNTYSGRNRQSTPLSFWTDQDILTYIKDNNIQIASVYGDIIKKRGKLKTSGVDRTGCVYCPISCHLNNKFKILKNSHPKLYDYCLNKLGMKEFLDYVGEHLGKELY